MRAVLPLALLAALFSPLAQADAKLAQAKNCMACHATNQKILGPAFQDVAVKYAKDKKAVDMLSEKIIKGGKGVWGEMPMPPNAVTPDEAKKLAAWVLTVK
jgi:cytochrome c